jgi:hypothetical protein
VNKVSRTAIYQYQYQFPKARLFANLEATSKLGDKKGPAPGKLFSAGCIPLINACVAADPPAFNLFGSKFDEKKDAAAGENAMIVLDSV